MRGSIAHQCQVFKRLVGGNENAFVNIPANGRAENLFKLKSFTGDANYARQVAKYRHATTGRGAGSMNSSDGEYHRDQRKREERIRSGVLFPACLLHHGSPAVSQGRYWIQTHTPTLKPYAGWQLEKTGAGEEERK